MSSNYHSIDSALKNYLTDFFVYNKNTKNRQRQRPYKWERIKEDLELINSLNPNLVLDLGCGDNRYKPLVKNLIGIDIAYDPNADIIGDITALDFEDNSVDAIIAYGSINFGDEELIVKQLTETKRVLKDKGIICISAYSKPKLEFNAVLCRSFSDNFYYKWTEDKCQYFTEKFNFSFIEKPKTVRRLNGKGKINETWQDIRSVRFNKDSEKIREITRLHWIWQK